MWPAEYRVNALPSPAYGSHFKAGYTTPLAYVLANMHDYFETQDRNIGIAQAALHNTQTDDHAIALVKLFHMIYTDNNYAKFVNYIDQMKDALEQTGYNALQAFQRLKSPQDAGVQDPTLKRVSKINMKKNETTYYLSDGTVLGQLISEFDKDHHDEYTFSEYPLIIYTDSASGNSYTKFYTK